MSEFEQLREIVKQLRAENGCPWDREQTLTSLKPAIIEEAAEVICGINLYEETGNADNLKEEIGDLLFVLFMEVRIAEEQGLFTLEEASKSIRDKMIRRHPHVFGNETLETTGKVLKRWDEIKKEEKTGKEWMNEHLPEAFDESVELIEKARIRKGYKAKES